jgi:hypothetical protein
MDRERTPEATGPFPADEEWLQVVLGTAVRQPNGIDIPPHGWAVQCSPDR